MPIPLPARRYVRAWEFRAGNQRVVHHATVSVISADKKTGINMKYPMTCKPDGKTNQ